MSSLVDLADRYGSARLLAGATALTLLLVLAAFVLAVATGSMEKKGFVAALSVLVIALVLAGRARSAES